MNFILNNFGIIIFLVEFSFCGDPHDISSYDPEEFDVNDLLNDPFVVEALESNGSKGIISSYSPEEFDVNDLLNDPFVIEALQSGESNIDEEPRSYKPSENKINPTVKRKRTFEVYKKLTSIGNTFKGNKRIPESFNRLQPAKVNPDNLTLGELEKKFYEQGSRHPWRELQEYPLKNYPKYWAHVCDYFWVKENPEDPRNRACIIKHLLFSDKTSAEIYYNVHHLLLTRAEVLRCSCHYYDKKRTKPVSPSVVFAVHKYTDNEYFILKQETRNAYTVSKFWTEIMLPIPLK